MAQQIRNGFNRAWVTIFDSHVTIFLSGLVLYCVGTEEVKGFALTLIIGMVWNLFTAVYVSRVIFEFWYTQGWLKKLTMMKMMDKTNIDFIGPRKLCMAGSVILIVLGLVATGVRGEGMYNIDFTGGTLVTIRLNEQRPRGQGALRVARGRASSARRPSDLPDVTVESLKRRRRQVGLTRFNIRTTEQKIEQGQAGRSSRRSAPRLPAGRDDRRRRPSRSPRRRAAGRRQGDGRADGDRRSLRRRPAVRAEVQHVAFNSTQSPRRSSRPRSQGPARGRDRQPRRPVRDRQPAGDRRAAPRRPTRTP